MQADAVIFRDTVVPNKVTTDGRTDAKNRLFAVINTKDATSSYYLCMFLNLLSSFPSREMFSPVHTGYTRQFVFSGSTAATEQIRSLGGPYSAYNSFMHVEVSRSLFMWSEEGAAFLHHQMTRYIQSEVVMPQLKLACPQIQVTDLLFLICEFTY